MNVRINENKTYPVKNANVKGIQLTLVAQALLANTDILAATTDWLTDPELIQIHITLKQFGELHTIAQCNLAALQMESNIDNYAARLAPKLYTSGIKTLFPRVAEAAGIKARYEWPYYIDFGEVINLDGDDELSIRIQFPEISLNTTNVDSSATYFHLEYENGIGVQHIIPEICTRSISADDGTLDVQLGDNVTRVTYVNYEGGSENITGVETADQFFTSILLRGDKFYDNRTVESVYSQFARAQAAEGIFSRVHPSVVLFDSHTELDQAHVRFNMVTTKLNAGKNWLVWRKHKTCRALVQKAAAMKTKHGKRNLAKALRG